MAHCTQAIYWAFPFLNFKLAVSVIDFSILYIWYQSKIESEERNDGWERECVKHPQVRWRLWTLGHADGEPVEIQRMVESHWGRDPITGSRDSTQRPITSRIGRDEAQRPEGEKLLVCFYRQNHHKANLAEKQLQRSLEFHERPSFKEMNVFVVLSCRGCEKTSRS